ncbi:MAG: hypothetical protein LBU19_01595 [Treponema sp.]|jgi:hypothetical protein|nr:hypothetical protein [Treponema sp.]
MERAFYFQTWLPNRPNTHPVHPMKHQGMIEDMVNNHATMLAWSMMGGGAVSLSFLQDQIDGSVPPQLRFHGYMNEREFNEDCLCRGITPYAVIYQAQNWEFPARFNADKTKLLEINIMRHEGEHDWYGTREFTRDSYPNLFPRKFEDYFPGGLVNSDGEKVSDLWEECCARTMYGEPSHSSWVEVEGYSKTCHGTCRNNPVWREYLKKQIEIVIDAGAVAIQLDECENPLTTVAYGGCFCKDCMKQFRQYLKMRRDKGSLRGELAAMDLETFNYAGYLKERHINWPERLKDIPFAGEYWDFQVETENRHFKELVAYTREYAKKTKGIDVKISGNFFNLHMLYRSSLADVDLCVTENRRTVFRRHEWYRMAAGYAGGKPLVLTESPYDGFIQKFQEHIHKGKGDDYYRLFIMEAAAHGISMCYPYGAWMGNKARDSFYAPRDIGREVQDFLFDNDAFLGGKSGAKVLVLYDYHSNVFKDWQSGQGEILAADNTDDLLSYHVEYDDRASWIPYFEIGKKLIDRRIPFDVCVLGDDGLVRDDFNAETIAPYDVLISAGCAYLTQKQAEVLRKAAKQKQVFIFGAYGENLISEADAAAKAGAAVWPAANNSRETVRRFCRAVADAYAPLKILDWDNGHIYIQQSLKEEVKVLHLFNYAFEDHRAVPQDMLITLRQDGPVNIQALSLNGVPFRVEKSYPEKGILQIKITNLPVYGMLVLKQQK